VFGLLHQQLPESSIQKPNLPSETNPSGISGSSFHGIKLVRRTSRLIRRTKHADNTLKNPVAEFLKDSNPVVAFLKDIEAMFCCVPCISAVIHLPRHCNYLNLEASMFCWVLCISAIIHLPRHCNCLDNKSIGQKITHRQNTEQITLESF
jgi:hypothetical protein